MDEAPSEWRAAPDTLFPQPDSPPQGYASTAPDWLQKDWWELADQAVAGGMPAHLTLLDIGGYPLHIRIRSCRRCSEDFRLDVPHGAPWSHGKATLSFVGKEIFVGDAVPDGAKTLLRVERALPVLPMMDNRQGMTPEVLAKLDERLAREMRRRGQAIPVVPVTPPSATEGALNAQRRARRSMYGAWERASRGKLAHSPFTGA